MIKSKQSKRALLSAVSRVISVILSAGAGTLLVKALGGKTLAVPVAVSMAIISFLLMWFVEYEREINND